MAPIKPERVFERVEPFSLRLVAAVRQPAPCLQEYRRSQEAIAVPPVARASGSAAEAEDALVVAVELTAFLRGLQPFLLGLRCLGMKPRLDRCILRKDVRQVGNEVLDDPHIGERIDCCLRAHVGNKPRASQPVGAVHVHGAGTADPSRHERRKVNVESTLFLIQNSASRTIGPQSSTIDMERIETGIAAGVGIVAIDLECLYPLRAGGCRPYAPLLDPRFRRNLEVSRNGKPLEPGRDEILDPRI